MGLLQKLKSALGLDGTGSSASGNGRDVDVTVEREPSTEDEDAVKGTDTASIAEPDATDTSGAAVETDADEPMIDEAEQTDAADAAESDDSEKSVEDVAETADDTGSSAPVTEIKGIGPAYADRLAGVDIETVGELAAADAAAIADETDLSESRVGGWIERAAEY